MNPCPSIPRTQIVALEEENDLLALANDREKGKEKEEEEEQGDAAQEAATRGADSGERKVKGEHEPGGCEGRSSPPLTVLAASSQNNAN